MSATLLGEPLTPGGPEWLQAISASKVAAIDGVSPWATAHSLWHLMAGTTPPEMQTADQHRGHLLEPVIRAMFAAAHPEWAVDEAESSWRNDDRPWQIATPDGLIADADHPSAPHSILEIKTEDDMRHWGEPGTDEVPPWYRRQAVWQMDTLGGIGPVIFAVCGPFELFRCRPKEYVVEYNPDEAAELRARANAFRMSIGMGVEPPADYYREEDRRVLRYKHPRVEANPGIELPAEVAVPWLEALAAASAATEAEAKTRADMLAFLGNGKTAVFNGHTIGSRRNGRAGNPPTFAKTNGLDPQAVLHPVKETAA